MQIFRTIYRVSRKKSPLKFHYDFLWNFLTPGFPPASWLASFIWEKGVMFCLYFSQKPFLFWNFWKALFGDTLYFIFLRIVTVTVINRGWLSTWLYQRLIARLNAMRLGSTVTRWIRNVISWFIVDASWFIMSSSSFPLIHKNSHHMFSS